MAKRPPQEGELQGQRASPCNGGGGGGGDDFFVPTIRNVVSTVNLGCKLDLRRIARHALNTVYNPRRFPAVVMRIREPRSTALIYGSGRLVVTGAKSEADSRTAARKFARVVQKLGFVGIQLRDFRVINVVASADAGFPVRLCRKYENRGELND